MFLSIPLRKLRHRPFYSAKVGGQNSKAEELYEQGENSPRKDPGMKLQAVIDLRIHGPKPGKRLLHKGNLRPIT